ncbi:hypothetical protein [Acaryochloris marina]|uniref:Uncharacterized protein n=1 Tax=Acaryochloris marina (strain MBIC 11017) TaxID=329726 RepID=A8ZK15_ACAM1|nr:hypothetical protein [Acaryochloris marina]ABW31515.1 hypothetical protein AM1_A0006 [Acaryochloris marina MBIC11017]
MTQVLTAQFLFPAKEFDTQYGPRLNAKIKVANGEEAKLWGPPGDVALLALRRGQTIQIAKDGKGKYSLVEQASAPGQAPVVGDAPLDDGALDGDTKSVIASYISNRAALYSFCYQEASRELGKHDASEETIKCAASTLFIAAQKKFGI